MLAAVSTHYAANLMAVCPKSSWTWFKALLHSVYDQPDGEAVRAQFDRVLDALADKLPKVAEHLEAARADVLVGAVLAEQDDEWAEGRRYLGLDVLARCRIRLVTDTATATSEEVTTPTIPALSA